MWSRKKSYANKKKSIAYLQIEEHVSAAIMLRDFNSPVYALQYLENLHRTQISYKIHTKLY